MPKQGDQKQAATAKAEPQFFPFAVAENTPPAEAGAPHPLPKAAAEKTPLPQMDEPQPLLPATAGAIPPPEAAAAESRRRRLQGLLPRFSDARQRKAGKNLFRFFVLLLILTLVARGTAGAALPRVETESPRQSEIIQRVQGNGTVQGRGVFGVDVPQGLTVKEVMASPGQSLDAGDALARFDADEVAEQLQREIAALKGLELKLQQLLRGTPHDSAALEDAQRRAERAQQDYDSLKARCNAELEAARQALAQAQAAEQQALDALNAITDPQLPEYQTAHEAWQAAAAETAAKKQALADAQSRTDSELLTAARALDDAKTALAGARDADAEARQKEGDAAAQNSLDASTLRLDITAQQEKVNALQALADSGGLLLAPAPGVAREVPPAGSKTSGDALFQLTDNSGGFEAELWLSQAEAEKLAAGDSCDIELSGSSIYYRPTVQGTVLSVGQAGDDGRVKVTIQLPDDEWKSGQTVKVQLVQSRQTHSLCVPLSALHAESDGYYVLVLQQQSGVLGQQLVAAKIPVTVVAQDDSMAAIEGALSSQDKVITSSNKPVQPGGSVRVAT